MQKKQIGAKSAKWLVAVLSATVLAGGLATGFTVYAITDSNIPPAMNPTVNSAPTITVETPHATHHTLVDGVAMGAPILYHHGENQYTAVVGEHVVHDGKTMTIVDNGHGIKLVEVSAHTVENFAK